MRSFIRTAAAALAAALLFPSAAMSQHDAEHLDAMSREHAHHTPAPNASAKAPAQDVVAREVAYATVDGREVRGYLARPANVPADARLPGVVVIHEWWGLNDNVRMMTRRLAGEGYAALAVDLYGGETAAGPQEARSLVQQVSAAPAQATANLRQAAEYLREHNSPTVGVMGWCFGGGWALETALRLPEQVDAAVMYYGRPVTERDRLAALEAPLLGIFGSADQGIPLERVREMEGTLRELGKEVDVQVYEGAGHAFANPSGQAYREEAAEDAWGRTIRFFDRHLLREDAP